TPAGQVGPQWGNVTDLAATNSGLHSGTPLNLNFIQQDRDGNSTVVYYLDADKNPFNGVATSLGKSVFAQSSTIGHESVAMPTTGVSAGQYYVLAKVSDDQGHVRYAYSGQITINTPAPIDAHLVNGVLLVNGTAGNDVIRISRSPSMASRLLIS